MFSYLGHNEQLIDDKKYYRVSVLSEDKENFSVVRIYTLVNNDSATQLDSYIKYEEITDDIDFKVRSDGKVSLVLKIH